MKPFDGTRGPRTGIVAVTTDGSGIATLTHNAGFVPGVAFVQPELDASWVGLAASSRSEWTTTTIKVRAWNHDGTAYVGTLATVHFLIWP